MQDLLHDSLGTLERLALIAVVVVIAHLAVRLVRAVSVRIMERTMDRSLSKARTVNSLITSILVFPSISVPWGGRSLSSEFP